MKRNGPIPPLSLSPFPALQLAMLRDRRQNSLRITSSSIRDPIRNTGFWVLRHRILDDLIEELYCTYYR